jgi:hypothetical protein
MAIIKSRDDRVILWGATVDEDTIRAELAYFDANLLADSYPVEAGRERYLVGLPDSVREKDYPGHAANIALSIIRPSS